MVKQFFAVSKISVLTAFIFLLLSVGLQAQGAPIANIHIRAASPRDVSASTTDEFDEPSAGFDVVALGAKVYLEGLAVTGAVVGGYQWSISAAPAGSTATLNSTSTQLVTLRPDKTGVFTISLTPLDAALSPTEPVTQSIDVNTYSGVGVLNTHSTAKPIAPNCGTGFCHGGSNAKPALNVLGDWDQSNHGQKLQSHLSGTRGNAPAYKASCLSCHTLGYNTNPAANNGGFDDVCASLPFDAATIASLVATAASTGVDQWPAVPAEVQAKSSIQCENCHSAGSLHPSHLGEANHRIAGATLSVDTCAVCHDASGGHHEVVAQWKASGHNGMGSHTSSGCVKCHSGKGFIDVRDKGLEPTSDPESTQIVCASCHNPHGSENEHQLRVAGDFALDCGQTYVGAGTGGLCMRCHNSRQADGEARALASSSGVHHGPQADMLLGVNGASFGLGFAPNSSHTTSVPDTCVHCHMATPPTATSKAGNHTFTMRDTKGTTDPSDDETNAVNACSSCHPSLTTYDRTAAGDYDGDGTIEGTQSEVKGLIALLRTKLLALTGATEDAGNGRIGISSSGFSALSNDKKRALYNYNYVMEDRSVGVHNTSYTVQLLQRSYYPLYNRYIVKDFPGIALKGPVQQAAAENWALYE